MENTKLSNYKIIAIFFILIGITVLFVMPINAAYFYDSAANQGQIIEAFTGNWAKQTDNIYFELEIADSDNILYWVQNDSGTSNNPYIYPVKSSYETLGHVYLDNDYPYINVESAYIGNMNIPVRLSNEDVPLSVSQVAFGFRLQIFNYETNELLPIKWIDGIEYGDYTPDCTIRLKCYNTKTERFENIEIDSTQIIRLTKAEDYNSSYIDFQIIINLPTTEIIQYPFVYLTECTIPMFSWGTIISEEENISGVVLSRTEVMVGRLSSDVINDGNSEPGEIGDIIIDFNEIPKIDLDGYDNELNNVFNKQEYQIYATTIKSIFNNEIFVIILTISITFMIIGYVLYGRK